MVDASPGTPPPLAPGVKVDRYELFALVREDDAGSVWLAYEAAVGGAERCVALRFASSRLAADERFRVMLRQEVKLATGVSHPNVAQVLALGGDDDEGAARGRLFVASEWVEGGTLADLRDAAGAKGIVLPAPIVLRILADACAGLHAAHLVRDRSGSLLNVVHGDVSASSIVLAANGAARVIDLGFRKAVARHAGGANLSWPTAAQAVQRIDRHADVWGVGAILSQALGDAAGGSGAGPDGTGPTVPSLVAELVLRARSADPLERFATAAEMQGAIEAAMMTLGISVTRASVAAFTKGLLRERSGPRAAGAGAAAREKAPLVLSIPTPAVDSVPATAQTVRPEGERLVVSTPAAAIPGATLDHGAPPAANTASAISRTIRQAPGARGKAALFAAGFVVAVLGSGVSGYLAMRARPRVAPAPPAAPVAVVAAAALAPSCPAGTVERSAPASTGAPASRLCVDLAPVTMAAYKACSDAGDCKRAAVENRWPGITPRDHASYDALCRERDPKKYGGDPANCVDRDMAAVYCEAQGARLPTDAESALAPDAPAAGFSEWGTRANDLAAAAGTRSYAIGFRCVRSL